MTKDLERMKYLADLLNEASRAYYAQDREIMSNFEYDRLYDELDALEKKTGVTLAGSPTAHVGYEAVDELPKEAHEAPMLSLDKTKSREDLRDWLQGKEGILSWKLDGLTVGTDAMCAACPNNLDGVCRTADKVAGYDRAVLDLCGLEDGEVLAFGRFTALVQARVLAPGLRPGVCGDCQWDDICSIQPSRWG